MKETIKRLSRELNLPEKTIEGAYKAYWEFIRETIQELPLKEDINEENFNKLRTNFNLPILGKLYCNYDRYRKVKKKHEYLIRLGDANKYKED